MTPRTHMPWRRAGQALAALLLVLSAAGGAAAQGGPQPSFGLPIDCVPDQTCWIVNYVDHDPTAGVRDYMCGNATYNGTSGTVKIHKGTDFAIRDTAVMRAGVSVLAAAGGRVAGTRDGMPDHAVATRADIAALHGKDCGNGVAIDHGGGWVTQYCHMREGSIAVRTGQRVEKGAPLGLVGLSGATEYPHVHFQVMHAKEIVDPFTGVDGGPRCGPGTAPLWDAATLAELPYVVGEIYNIGFAGEKPSIERVRAGGYHANEISRRAPALVLWTEIFNLESGDRVRLTIREPGGADLIDRVMRIDGHKVRYWVFTGKRPHGAWPAGTYTGEVRVEHADGTASRRTATVTLR